jgi:hypothetical protein
MVMPTYRFGKILIMYDQRRYGDYRDKYLQLSPISILEVVA